MRSGEGLHLMEARIHRFRSTALRCILLAAAVLLLCCPFGPFSWMRGDSAHARQDYRAGDAREISAGLPAAGELGGSGSRLFKLDLSEGQYVRVAIDKGDFHLSASLLSADGQVLSDHTSRRFGALRFSFVVGAPGAAYLRLSSLEESPEARHYELRVEAVGPATPKDYEAAAASNAYSEAEALRAKWDQQSLRAAIVKYSEALAAWTSAGDGREGLWALMSVGECHFVLSEYREALDAYTRALSLSRSTGDKPAELDALNDAGYVHVYLGENAEALRSFEQVLSYLAAYPGDRSIETRRRKAQTLNNMGEVYYSLSERRKALDYFGRALTEWAEVGDRSGEALARLNLGYTYTDLGDLQNASEHYSHSLALWQAVGDLRGEALARTALGGLQTFLGDKQAALDYHRQAMQAFQALGNYQGEAAAWNGMGQVYEDLNQPSAALDSYQSALELYERIGNRDFAALSQYYVGRVYLKMDDPERALKEYEQSARLSRQVGDRQIEAHAIRGIGMVYESHGQRERALTQYAQVLRLYERIGDRRWQARALNNIGYVYDGAGDKRKALAYYRRALALSRAVEDRREEVSTLYNLARAERDCGHPDEALSHISSSVALIESLRMKVVGEQLRTSYFASVHQHYELYIDLLMQEHRRRPGAGFAAAALQASESARARSLLEIIAERDMGSQGQPGDDLLGRERALWQQLTFKLEARTRLLNGPHDESQAAEGAGEIRALTLAYQEVLDQIKQQSPLYASLTQTQMLRPGGIQGEVRDDSVLLEYFLGEQKSYMWAVTPGAISGYELPPRATVEGLAREVYSLLTARQPVAGESAAEYRRRVEYSDANYWQRAGALSQLLLGQAASQIAGKRLLIICDGALYGIPFDALPEPDPVLGGRQSAGAGVVPAGAVPLVVGHEVVTAPSASVMSALQARRPAGASPLRLVAVLADPVFDGDDSRVMMPGGMRAADLLPPEESDLNQALRDVSEGRSEISLPRLSSSLREAKAIEDLTPAGERMISTGFAASLEKVTGGGLSNFCIIHFATHGIFDDEHPELSGLILSRVDENGRRRNSFLRADEIYNLRLNADLVVLSACRTGLGHNVTGEGILGITRAFMYAGSRSVVASLWKVNDEATAELMERFYGAMFKDGLPPSAALRAAKEAMWKQEHWRSPYYWAAFVMQGEYDQRFPQVTTVQDSRPRVIALALPVLCLALLLIFWYTRRRKPLHA